jgi:hypothetical protein
MARYSGRLLMGTALLHNAVGIAIYARPLANILRDGGLNAVEPHRDRTTAFWFLVSGGLIFTLGQFTDWTEQRDTALPPSLGWSLLAFGAGGAFLMPVSGFWLVIPQGIAALRRASKREAISYQLSGDATRSS